MQTYWKRVYKQARLPYAKAMEDFEFAFQPSVKKAAMLDLATCGFVEKHANIFFIGQPGTGKTHLSIALALEALKFGKTVLFTTVWDMITMLQQSRADYSYQKRLQWYTKPDLLILDELGYRSLDKTTGEDFYETYIPHGGSDFGEFFIGKTTHIAFPGAAAGASARRSD